MALLPYKAFSCVLILKDSPKGDSHMRNGVKPNAYTYSALLKALGEHGQWGMAEKVTLPLCLCVLPPLSVSPCNCVH